MAVFNQNSLSQVSGFNNPIISGELVWMQKTFWNLAMSNGTTPVDLTGVTIDAQIIRRRLENVKDTRYGLSFDISNYTPTPTAIPLSITNRDDATGSFTLLIDDTSWGLVDTDTELAINDNDGVGFSGRIKIGFPQSGATPPEDNIIFLLFLVRSDGIVKV